MAAIGSRRAGSKGKPRPSLQPRAASSSALTQHQANPSPAAALLNTLEFWAGDEDLHGSHFHLDSCVDSAIHLKTLFWLSKQHLGKERK